MFARSVPSLTISYWPSNSGRPLSEKWICAYAARWSSALTRCCKSSGTTSDPSSAMNVAVGSRFETTTGALIVSPSARRTPVTRPSPVVISSTRACSRIVPPASTTCRSMCAQSAPIPPSSLRIILRAGRGHRERKTHRAPGRVRATVGGVHREERQHAAQHRVPFLVGQEAVDHVHHRAEHRGADRLALLLVVGAREHLVERLRRLPHVAPADRRAGASHHAATSAMPIDRVHAVHFDDVVHELLGVGVEDHRRRAVLADVDRHHLVVERRARIEIERVVDLVRNREQHRARRSRSGSRG